MLKFKILCLSLCLFAAGYILAAEHDVKMLSSLPGIGPKTAKRIIIELKDKFIDSPSDELPIEDNETFSDTFNALKSLGFTHNQINQK